MNQLIKTGRAVKKSLRLVTVMVFITSVIAESIAVVPQTRADFSGRWELDKARSRLRQRTKWDGLVLVVDHRGPKLSITTIREYSGAHDGASRLDLAIGGEVSLKDDKGPRIYHTAWQGPRLVIKWNQGGERTETWSLSRDNKTLTIISTATAPGAAPEKWTYIMIKK